MYGQELATRVQLCRALFYLKLASLDPVGCLAFTAADERPKTESKAASKPKSSEKNRASTPAVEELNGRT